MTGNVLDKKCVDRKFRAIGNITISKEEQALKMSPPWIYMIVIMNVRYN